MSFEPNNNPSSNGTQTLAADNSAGPYALSYRVRTYAGFKAAMLADLAGNEVLRGLGNVPADDPTLALVDAWAATLDVLTFYQERIANEAICALPPSAALCRNSAAPSATN